MQPQLCIDWQNCTHSPGDHIHNALWYASHTHVVKAKYERVPLKFLYLVTLESGLNLNLSKSLSKIIPTVEISDLKHIRLQYLGGPLGCRLAWHKTYNTMQYFTFPLRIFKWTFSFEMWSIPSWTNRFQPHPHTRHLSGLTSSPSNNVACLLTFTWRWTRIAIALSAESWCIGYSKPYVMSD